MNTESRVLDTYLKLLDNLRQIRCARNDYSNPERGGSMHLGEKIACLMKVGSNSLPVHSVKSRRILRLIPLPSRKYVAGWLWFEDGKDHWSVIWAVGEEKEQARRNIAVRIDVLKETGTR